MGYVVPIFSRTLVDRSARKIISGDLSEDEEIEARNVISNWRSSHVYPLNTIYLDLKSKAGRVSDDNLCVQRLKRTRSILSKLEREKTMRLTQMQDIGGCRCVLETIDDVLELRQLYSESRAEHKFLVEDNYILNPQLSGYRSHHLIYSYRSRKKVAYNKLLFEVQIRTILQHAWATAVETVGAVLGQSLKSSEGEEDWLEFFKYAAAALALLEGQPAIPGITSNRKEITSKLRYDMRRLDVVEVLGKYSGALKATESTTVKDAGYFLLVLSPEEPKLEIFAFRKNEQDKASELYEQYERNIPGYKDLQLPLFPELNDYSGAQAVLVGAESFKMLRQSYPNYYLDTEAFINALQSFTDN